MAKRYTARELNEILKAVLANGYEFMENIIIELRKLNDSKEPLTPIQQQQLKTYNIYLTIVNDIIHPGHKISYQYFKKYKEMIDWFQENQKLAFEKKLVPICYAVCCDPNGIKSSQKVLELQKKMDEFEALQRSASTPVH